MKKIYSIIALIFASVAIVSCERDGLVEEESGEGIKITMRCADDTKATKDGVGNENLIKTIDYFLFTEDGSSGVYRYKGRLSPSATSYYTFYIQSSFVSNGDYTVFAIVNYPGSEDDLGPDGGDSDESERKTLAELQALAVAESTVATFCSYNDGDYEAISTDDVNLVMTGLAAFTVTDTERPLVGTAEVDLKRLCSKITMDFYIADKVERTSGTATEVWTPMVDGGIRLYLCNGNEHTLLSGKNPEGADSLSLFDYEASTDVTAITGKDGYSNAFSSPAFYTYPEGWSYGGHDEPYIKLIIPWMLTRTNNGLTTTSQKEFYYKVVLPTTKFESNKWYNLILDVTQLGSDMDNDAVNLITSYQVADWGAEDIIISSLVQGYYLDVAESNRNLTIYSDYVDIPFTASGKVELQDISVTYEDFTTNTTQTISDPENYITLYDDYVRVERTINDDYSGTSYDVSQYTFTFTLHLKASDTDTSYDKTVVVTQEPPLYINSTQSDGYVWVNGSNSTGTIYDDSGTRSHEHFLGTVVSESDATGTSSNNSPYLIEIAATIIDMTMEIDGEDTKVVIGDPRGDEVDLTGNLDVSSYRPTSTDSKNVIAPKLIFASSYGKTYSSSYEGAIKRCAAYQESGLPAGRWRLPTMAEIQFAIKLSDDSKIESLFGADETSGYWSGSGELRLQDEFITLDSDDITGGSSSYYYRVYTSGWSSTYYYGYTRCVYDSWYWGNEAHSSYDSSNPDWIDYQPSL